MIIDQIVEVKTNKRNRQHYLDLGYELKDHSEILKIEAKHLHPNSKIKVECKCVDCDKIRNIQFCQYRKRCFRCSKIESNKKNIKPRPLCNFCGKELKYLASTSCINCHRENFPKGEHAYAYRCGKPNCIDCGSSVSNWPSNVSSTPRCRECYFKLLKENSNPMYNKTNCMKRFSAKVKYRDNYTCRLCGSSENLVAHHLQSFDIHIEGREDVDNGICLCQFCHITFHKKYGYGCNTTVQFEEYKESLL